MTVTSGVLEQIISSLLSELQLKFLYLPYFKFRLIENGDRSVHWLNSWTALEEDSMCLCVYRLEDEPCADRERQHGELVQLCEGSQGSVLPTLSHTQWG